MKTDRIHTVYGLKWNPFSPDVPVEGLYTPPKLDDFFWRLEHLVLDGGFSAITGDLGIGKSAALRLLKGRLEGVPELCVQVLQRPRSSLRDFYRELADLFAVDINTANRYASFDRIRDQWLAGIKRTLFRSVLIIDEAQSACDDLLSELRFLTSTNLDSRCILAVVLLGDDRLFKKLATPELAPLESRLHVRHTVEPWSTADLIAMLKARLHAAGGPHIMAEAVITAVASHCFGNPRTMLAQCNELLLAAAQRDAPVIDEQLFFDVLKPTSPRKPRGGR